MGRGAESPQAMISTMDKWVGILSNGENRIKLNKYYLLPDQAKRPQEWT